MVVDPFSQEKLTEIFDTLPNNSDIIRRRESTALEFKENFQSSNYSDYGKTMSAFANHSGGYILFGVKDKPHVLTGMTNSNFTNMDPSLLTQFLNNYFSPSFEWIHYLYKLNKKDFGLIYVYPLSAKPAICSRSNKHLKEGDIYYRYTGATRLITASDLHILIENRIETERKSWRSLLQRATHVIPTSTYLLDINQGKVQGEEYSFVIDQNLLDKVNFIHEGKFDESGEPTLRVVGDVEVVRTEAVAKRGHDIPIDPTKQCKLYEKDCVSKLKERIGCNIPFGTEQERTLTGAHLRAIVKAHNIKTPTEYYYRPDVYGSRPFYGEAIVNWIVQQFQADPQFFYKASEKAKSNP